MLKASPLSDDHLQTVAFGHISASRKNAGRALIALSSLLLLIVLLVQILYRAGSLSGGFDNWRPVLYAYLIWAAAIGAGQVLIRGEPGHRALFLLPALLFTISLVIFPTFFGLYIAFTDWNLSSLSGRRLSGLDNFRTLLHDPYYWNALRNMIFYVLAVLVQYAIAFGLALLLNADIRARKFFRVAFLLPFMLSPVAVSWMIGKSLMEYRFGPAATLMRHLGWDSPAFFTTPWIARLSIAAMDSWVWIPFMMVPVSITAIIIRIIFQLKLADIVINVTAGGPGGATDTVSSFIFREYRDRSNVGYGTMLAEFYLVIIIVFVMAMLNF